MKKADNRNMMAPSKRPILSSLGKSPILSAAMDKAARVPGEVAFLIGLIRLSNSSVMQTHSVYPIPFLPLIQPLIPMSVFFSFSGSFAVSSALSVLE